MSSVTDHVRGTNTIFTILCSPPLSTGKLISGSQQFESYDISKPYSHFSADFSEYDYSHAGDGKPVSNKVFTQ